jgi:phosphopantetheine--protein transferase-like protein
LPCIGNDIVYLDLPDNREKIRDRRFLDRVFTSEERTFIKQWPENGNAVLWAFWAGKESAYKALSKSMPGIPSTPRRYEVRFAAALNHCFQSEGNVTWSGVVETPAGQVACQVLLTPDYVHCLAVAGGRLPDEPVIARVLKWDREKDISEALRRAAVRHIAAAAAACPSAVEIIRHLTPKGLGPPCILVDGHRTAMDITLSHDGRYGAFALLDHSATGRNILDSRCED